jgi:CubicO group peptidase (beta-lactamase class C family)
MNGKEEMRMRTWRSIFVILTALALIGASATFAQEAQVKKEQPAAAPAGVAALQAPAAERAGAPLTKADVDSWLDGLIPYGLSVGDVAGAVVVVVRDGQVLTERGFGFADMKSRRPVDPERTLFRPGSVSKLFTWTAVMQLVEAGKLDLDADINSYLDFKIPPREGAAITLRNLMTHTPGLGEYIKGMFVIDPKRVRPLGEHLARWTPPRIFAPGRVPAYSNYGAGLAGYIVQRVSGETFDDYIEKHIFAPLGMAHSSFRQPLPEALKADMASGYLRASMPARPYELIVNEPAGSLSATGADVARFMIAHLQNGLYGETRILKEETARTMHAPSPKVYPALNGMALGFYHEDRNGHQVVGHGGDTEVFHSDLHLLLDDGVGLFVSFNSLGKEGAAGTIRTALFHGFMDRYFPAPAAAEPTLATAKEHGRLITGRYWWSRRSVTGFFSMTGLLGQTKVTVDADGNLMVGFKDPGGAVIRWREVAPFVWKDATGQNTLAAAVKDGRIESFSLEGLAPFMILQPVPNWADSAWNMPLLIAMVVILALAVLLWPVQALVRRHYKKPFPFSGREALLRRLARLTALIDLAGLAAYGILVSLISKGLFGADDPTDPFIRIAQVLCVLGIVGAFVALGYMVTTWVKRERGLWTKIGATLLTLACVAFVWFVWIMKLVTVSLNY